MDRRGFIVGATATLGAVAAKAAPTTRKEIKVERLVADDAPPRNRRPYADVDWSKSILINTTSHGHCLNQMMLDTYLKHGFGLMTISNYYPSAPYVPGKGMAVGHYLVHHDFPVMVNGKRTGGPFDWSKIVSEWSEELPPELRKSLPFKVGEPMFPKWPEGILEAPNAEHHGFRLANGRHAGSLHMCAPGSAFKSGTFDAHDKFKTKSHGYEYGSGEFWGTAVDRLIGGLIVKDGGGVTINHPTWTNLRRDLLLDILDWDPRVLGIEVLESGVNSEHYWDWALATGRQCFGFFVPDWGLKNDIFGVNVLVVPERTVEACLRAYRKGNFYGANRGYGELCFTKLSFDGKFVTAETDKPARFEIKTARGVVKEATGTSVVWEMIPRGSSRGPHVDIFARVKATAADGCGEQLYSQPFMLF